MSGLSLSLLAEIQRLLAPAFMTRQIMLMQKTPAPTKKSAKPEAPAARILSPRRKTTQATSLHELAVEQLEHFHIDPKRSEEHTSELQSPDHLLSRLLLEKKK